MSQLLAFSILSILLGLVTITENLCTPGHYYLQDYPVIILENKSFDLPEGITEDDLSPDAADRRNGIYCNYKKEDGSFIFPYFQESCTPFVEGIAVVGESVWNYQTKHCPDMDVDALIYTDDFERDFDYVDFSVCDHEFDRRLGYMRSDGTILTEFSYHGAARFQDGYALTYEIDEDLNYRKIHGEEYTTYEFIDKSGRVAFGNDAIVRYARSFVNGITLANFSHESVSITDGEDVVCDDYFHNIYLLDKQFRKLAGPFSETYLFDNDSNYLYVESEDDHGYLSFNNKWICHSCWGANVSHNRACLYAEKEESNKIHLCRIINERGKPVANYSLYGFLFLDMDNFDYSYKNLLVTFDNTVGCLNRFKVLEAMLRNQFYRLKYHLKLLTFKITKPSHYDYVITTQDGYILWPLGWNDPCADTDGVIVWPEGACKQ